MSGALGALVRDFIRQDGPIGLDRFMALALGHPSLGYYTTRDPLGTKGDFTTAPEISQMFGELIGLWCGAVHAGLGAPHPVALVELGPGRGTLMADLLRAAGRATPTLTTAASVHFVETSPVLRQVQAETLGRTGVAPQWHDTVDTLPDDVPLLAVANEFFDALPVRHYQRGATGWHERLVGLDPSGALAFGLAAEPEPSVTVAAPPGTLLEVAPAARAIMSTLARRLARQGGAFLTIDYGYAGPRFGESLQAMRAHRFVDPLDEPGEADLTAHVDFTALSRAAMEAGALSQGPVTQGAFLRALGIEARAAALSRAHPDMAHGIATALQRLTGPDPGMGTLFKVLAVTPQAMLSAPGFEPAT